MNNFPNTAKKPHGMVWIWIVLTVVSVCAAVFLVIHLTRDTPTASRNTPGSLATGSSNSGANPLGAEDPNGPSSCTNATCTDNPSTTGEAPVAGTVTAVSANSLTIKNFDDNKSVTYAVTNATTMLSGPGSPAVAYDSSKIAVGDSIGVFANGSTAERIMLNFEVQSSLTPQ